MCEWCARVVDMYERTDLIIVPSSVHVGQLLEAGAPVVEVVIVLVPRAGGVERADGAGGGAAALVVEHQQGVVRRSRGVVVGCSKTLNGRGGGQRLRARQINSEPRSHSPKNLKEPKLSCRSRKGPDTSRLCESQRGTSL